MAKVKIKESIWQRISYWWQSVEWLSIRKVAIALLLVGIIVGVSGSLYDHNTFREFLEAFYANVSTELISIALTVLVINWLYEKRDDKRLKGQLIREMGSTDNGIAQRAVDELRAHGWLLDGSLSMANLNSANLKGANLVSAKMMGTMLIGANLEGAWLVKASLHFAVLMQANLRGSHLGDADLIEAEMRGVNLIEADLRSASLLAVDLRNANLHEANLGDANLQLADFGAASLQDTYLQAANLQGAKNLTIGQLSQARTLKGAQLPDGTVLPANDSWQTALEDWAKAVRTDGEGYIIPAT